MKTILLAIFLLLFGMAGAQSELFKAQWNYTQKTMRLIDSSANYVLRQHNSICCRVSKQKYHSNTNKNIKHRTRIRYKKGNILVKEKYKIRSECKIKVLRVNGQQVFITSVFHKKGFGGKVKNIFTSLGGGQWHWTYSTNDINLPAYKVETISGWQPN